jgi:pyrimidine-specific ribonucleoside hydrolase
MKNARFLIAGCISLLSGVAAVILTLAGAMLAAENGAPRSAPKPIPLIDVTDLYHPHQDVGDNFDIIAAYGLPELDLRAVVLDCTEPFRQPVAQDPGAGLFPDASGPREPGFIPVWQLNYIFGRNVPCATCPFTRMKSVGDKLLDAPPFQQQGIELILRTLRESAEPVHIVSFGSARAIAAAYNREPELFRKKLARLHLCAGGSSPPAAGYIEWNVALDPLAIVCLLRSDLRIAIYPDAANNANAKGYGVFSAAFSYDPHNTFYKLPDLRFIRQMDAPLRRYLEYAFGRSSRVDFLRATEVDGPPLDEQLLAKEHYVWETAVWICVSGRKLVKRADGTHRIIPAEQVLPIDKVLPNELHPCEVKVRDGGLYEYRETAGPANFSVYYRGDPRENEAALREALPALYLSFRAPAQEE